MSLNNHFSSIVINCPYDGDRIHLEIAAAPMPSNEINTNFKESNTTLYVPAYPNQCGDGDVASNFRYKGDNEINNIVCSNWMEIFKNYKQTNKPVYITAISRNDRLISLKMKDDGSIIIIGNDKKELKNETHTMIQFLESFQFNKTVMKKVREASSGSHYYTYLADMISMINIMNSHFNPHMFKKVLLSPEIVPKGDKRLKPVIKQDGKIWNPINGNDYLYFNTTESEDSLHFMFLKEEYIHVIYRQLQELISLNENSTKKMMRNYFLQMVDVYTRWSDFWINDIDDALTILMIINCFNHTRITSKENNIKTQFMEITKSFFNPV